MKQITSAANEEIITKAIQDLIDHGEGTNDSLWLAYGSYVINNQHAQSDLDLLCIDDKFKKNSRIVKRFRRIPVHLSKIPTTSLIQDGKEGLFGGYFTGKIIN